VKQESNQSGMRGEREQKSEISKTLRCVTMLGASFARPRQLLVVRVEDGKAGLGRARCSGPIET